MKIQIKEAGGKGFIIIIPNILLMSSHILNLLIKYTNFGKGRLYNPEIINEIIKEFKKCVKYHKYENGKFDFVDIEGADGDIVKITF